MNKSHVLLCSLFLVSASISQSVDIFYEIAKGHHKAVKQWRDTKPDVSIRDEQGQSIVHAAVQTGDLHMVKLILSCHGDVNILSKAGQTALDLAIDYGNKDIIFALIYKKALVTTLDNQKYVQALFEEIKNNFIYRLTRFIVGAFVAVILYIPIVRLVVLFGSESAILFVFLAIPVLCAYGFVIYTVYLAIRSVSLLSARSRQCYLLDPKACC